MIRIASTARDRELAQQIADDLKGRGYSLSERVERGQEHVLIALVSPGADGDAGWLREAETALDEGQRIVPVLMSGTTLPTLLDHLTPLEFSRGYDADTLAARLDEELAPGARRPLRVRTTQVKKSNERTVVALLALVIVIGIVSCYFIAIGWIRPPREEYEAIDTEAAMTRDVMIAPTMQYLATVLPRSTEAAEAFPATYQALPTRLRPFVAFTATAMSEQLLQFEVQPTPEATDGE